MSSGPDGSIDLAIVIDRTGSMSPYIEKVKEDLEVIFTELQTVAKSFQVGLVSYDDFFPEGLDFFGAKVELQLTDKIDDVRTALDNLIVSGGGDTPEAVHTGVWLALTGLTGWQAGTKIMLVIGKLARMTCRNMIKNACTSTNKFIA